MNLKWLVGIILLIVFGITLVFGALAKATEKETVVDATTLAVALMFNRNGLDDESEIKEIQRKLKLGRTDSFQLIPGLNITVTAEDFNLENKTPREARLAFFRQLTEPIYDEGAAGLAKLATNEEMRQSIVESAGPLAIVTAERHALINKIFQIGLAISAVLFIALIALSFRFGRLVSPAIVLLITSVPGAVLFFIIKTTAGKNLAPPKISFGESGMMESLGSLAGVILPPMAGAVLPVYLVPAIIGAALLVIAILGKIVYSIVRRTRRSDTSKVNS